MRPCGTPFLNDLLFLINRLARIAVLIPPDQQLITAVQEVLCCLAYHSRCPVHHVMSATTPSWYAVALSLLALDVSCCYPFQGLQQLPSEGTSPLLHDVKHTRKYRGGFPIFLRHTSVHSPIVAGLAAPLLTRTSRPCPPETPRFELQQLPLEPRHAGQSVLRAPLGPRKLI